MYTLSRRNIIVSEARIELLGQKIWNITAELAGSDLPPAARTTSFVELGFDSLFLTQLSTRLNRELKVKLKFRQLSEEFPTIEALAKHLEPQVQLDAPSAPSPVAAPVAVAALPSLPSLPVTPANDVNTSSLERVFAQQLQIMASQLAMLGGAPVQAAPVAVPASAQRAPVAPLTLAAAAQPAAAAEEPKAPAKPFGAQARIERQDASNFTPRQQRHIEQLIAQYNEKTKGSKAYTQQHRAHLADPRAVSGFHPRLKEMTYSIVAKRSSGSRIWDVDGNEWIDMLNGYGSCFFGHAAPFITKALHEQVDAGFEIGPQNYQAGVVAEQFCRMTGHERAAFCNTGSEAVLGAIRMARTINGKQKVVMFNGAYHGINDEVIVRAGLKGQGLPAAAGIPREHTSNIIMFDYGDPAALAAIEAQADDIAAVIVEPVQSRRPELQPREFLHALRALTEKQEIALIIDEVVCGFRVAQGGAQEYFGIKADIATYGKVVGGGLSIGVIAGKRQYMDALDGGHWQFGDASVPEVGVTYFAGTFVRHPLALAAARASLTYLEQQGPDLQKRINARATELANAMNEFARQAGVPVWFGQFSSVMKPHWSEEQALPDLLFAHMRLRGIHIYDGRPCFLTIAHGDAEVAAVLDAFKEAIHDMQHGGFFVRPEQDKPAISADPPVPGARLGRDQHGNPAWFMPDPARPGKYQLIAAG